MIIPDYNCTSIEEATALQNSMRGFISLQTVPSEITTIAGADISHNKNSDTVYAGIVVLSYPQMEVLSYSLVEAKTTFPYVPGYLGFREVPALLQAWQQLPEKPDVMVLDGQGITHPRQMGIAAHFGLLARWPAIGCAKSMLYGNFPDLSEKKFGTSPITDRNNNLLGYALRTKDKVKPVYISPGHMVSVPDSLAIMKNCVQHHRIPEPTRQAHDYVNLLRTSKLKPGFYRADVQGSLF
jgi:deoxyribonuclease V